MRTSKERPRSPRSLFTGSEGLRLAIFVIAAFALIAVVFGSFDDFFKTEKPKEEPKPAELVDVPIPSLNLDLIRKAKDETATQRINPELEIYEHLLIKALEIEPGSLRALGMKKDEYIVADIQKQPGRYRGKPVWFAGTIQDLRTDPAYIPGLKRRRTLGQLRTDDGKDILFCIVDEVPKGLTLGSYARVEGFFFKLRDQYHPTRVQSAPFLVGKDLLPAMKELKPVTKLDPKVLAGIHDKDLEKEAAEIEPLPFFHLMSYALNRPKPGGWKKEFRELDRKSGKAILNATGEVARGTPFRVLGSLYEVRIIAAEANPLGIDFWTYGWIEHPEAGTIGFRLPGRLGGKWRTGDYVVLYGYFMKRHYYETLPKNGARNFKAASFFVSDTISPWRLVSNPTDLYFKIVMTAIATILIAVLGFFVIRDSKGNREVREALLERRRSRRLAKRSEQ